jgi:hypothetical protein
MNLALAMILGRRKLSYPLKGENFWSSEMFDG